MLPLWSSPALFAWRQATLLVEANCTVSLAIFDCQAIQGVPITDVQQGWVLDYMRTVPLPARLKIVRS